MSRRQLLASGPTPTEEPSGGGYTPPAEDMTLNTYRAVTMAFGPAANPVTLAGSGLTIRKRVFGGTIRDSKALRLRLISGDVRVVGRFSLEYGGTNYPITWGGQALATCPPNTLIESDPTPAWKVFRAGQPLYIRAHSPGGETLILIGGESDNGDTTDAMGATTGSGVGGQVAGPVSILGMTTDTVCPAFVGDSITHQGGSSENGWCNLAANTAGVPSLGFGIPVTVFSSVTFGRWGDDPVEALAPATHMLCQFSVNDLRIADDVASVKGTGIEAWRWLKAQRNVPLYQTTTTPIVDITSGGGATLEGQTLVPAYHARRQNFIAWLRDGAPIDGSDQAVATGGTGIRAGQAGHPLAGIVDIAAATEVGSTGKWRVDLGGSLSEDGVHPTGLGMTAMAPPVTTWATTLTTSSPL